MTAATIATGIRFRDNRSTGFDHSEGSNESVLVFTEKSRCTEQRAHAASSNLKQHASAPSVNMSRLQQQSNTSQVTVTDHGQNNRVSRVLSRSISIRRKTKQSQSNKEYFRLRRINLIHRRKRRITDMSLAFALVGVVLMIVETELTMAHVYAKEDRCSLLMKIGITLSTICLLLLVTAYHMTEIELFMMDNGISDRRIAISSGRIARFLLEFMTCALHPLPCSHNLKCMLAKGYKGPPTYAVPMDLFLSLPMFLRLYLISRVMLLHSRMISDASSRSIGALNRINFNSRFVLKALMTLCPGTVIITFVLTLFMIASWTVRACEIFNDPQRHSNILNSMWLIAVTFLAVGYGDIVPQTYCGRAVCVVSAMMGVSCTATMVAVLTRKLELTRAEKHVHDFMMDSRLNKRLRESAAIVLQETWRIYKLTKLSKVSESAIVRSHQQNFLKAVQRLRRLKIERNELSDNVNSMTDMSRTVSMITDSICQLGIQQVNLEAEIRAMTSQMEAMRAQLSRLPESMIEVMQRSSREVYLPVPHDNEIHSIAGQPTVSRTTLFSPTVASLESLCGHLSVIGSSNALASVSGSSSDSQLDAHATSSSQSNENCNNIVGL